MNVYPFKKKFDGCWEGGSNHLQGRSGFDIKMWEQGDPSLLCPSLDKVRLSDSFKLSCHPPRCSFPWPHHTQQILPQVDITCFRYLGRKHTRIVLLVVLRRSSPETLSLLHFNVCVDNS